MELEDLEVFNQANMISDEIWGIVIKWDYFQKDTIGKQVIKSSDSIAANVAEGYGRYFYKENLQFCYYARGSLYETKTWLKKMNRRELISDEHYNKLMDDAITLQKKLNGYIKHLRNNQPSNKQLNK